MSKHKAIWDPVTRRLWDLQELPACPNGLTTQHSLPPIRLADGRALCLVEDAGGAVVLVEQKTPAGVRYRELAKIDRSGAIQVSRRGKA